jgi:hypothetical protein
MFVKTGSGADWPKANKKRDLFDCPPDAHSRLVKMKIRTGLGGKKGGLSEARIFSANQLAFTTEKPAQKTLS